MKSKGSALEPSSASLREIPEVEFGQLRRGRRNPFARRVRAEGWELLHEGPSRSSLREMPEIDPSSKGRRSPYAKRIEARGIELQVGRGRPRAGKEKGPSVTKSVRLPPALWKRLEQEARANGVTLHAIVRAALVDWLARSRVA
jgi:hypothetical protein